MNRRHFLALTTAAALTPVWARADAPWDADFAAFITDGLKRTRTPGLSVAIVREGKTVMAHGFGLADIASGRPATADTVFHIASVSKTVTGTAMMMLFQDGKFKLDDPVNRYLDFKVVHPQFPDTDITFRHLMTHTSGISDDVYNDTDAFAVTGDPTLSLRDFLTGYLTPGGQWYAADTCFKDKPGTVWAYSNVAVALLGYLAGRVGTDLKTLTQDRLFAPLGMTHTSWTYAGLNPDQVATPYDAAGDAPKALPATGYPDWPAGLLRTSANDFARFLAIYTHPDARYLNTDTLKTMLTADPVPPQPRRTDVSQALAWQLRSFGGYHVASHAGSDPGAATVATIDLDRRTAVLAFANASDNRDFRGFQKEIVTRLLDRAKQV